jgi:hypothetical protein
MQQIKRMFFYKIWEIGSFGFVEAWLCVSGKTKSTFCSLGYFFYVFMQQKFHCDIVGSSVILR